MLKINLQEWMQGKVFWLGLILLGFILESVALYYQYILQEPPCVLCIHFRLLTALLIIFSTVGLWLRGNRTGRIFTSFLLLSTFAGMAERSYQLLGTERGFVLGSCSMDLGLPQWFAIQDWIPWLFEVKTTCGYTPIIAFNISMAEALTAMSIFLVVFSTFMLLISLARTK